MNKNLTIEKINQVIYGKETKIMLLIGLILFIIRLSLFGIESNDYKNCLLPWFEQLKHDGGFNGLSTNISNYNIPYITLMSLMTYIPISPLYQIKLLSIIFDYGTAILGYNIVNKFSTDNNSVKGVITYILLLSAPTVILNSAAWGQCDSIYTFFIIFSLYNLLKKHFHIAFILLGCAFSFKLQFMFIVPLFGIYALCKHPKLLLFFIYIPIVNFLLCLPSMLFGISPIYTYEVYFGQTGFWHLACNVANLSTLLPDLEVLSFYMQLFTVILFCILLVIMFLNRRKWNGVRENEITLTLALLSVFISYYFLPCMHDRYFYIADVLSIIWWILYGSRRNLYVPLIINIVSLVTYIEALAQFIWLLPLQILSVALFIGLLLLLKQLYISVYSVTHR